MEERVRLFIEAAQQQGVLSAALQDAISRAEREFAGEDHLTELSVRLWAERLKSQCPHLFGTASRATPASATPAALGRGSKRPVRVPPTPEQQRALDSLPPTQRMTEYRRLQDRAKT
jgi:hypothetical protein